MERVLYSTFIKVIFRALLLFCKKNFVGAARVSSLETNVTNTRFGRSKARCFSELSSFSTALSLFWKDLTSNPGQH